MRTIFFLIPFLATLTLLAAPASQPSPDAKAVKETLHKARAVFADGDLEKSTALYHFVGVRQVKAAAIFAANDIALAQLEKAAAAKFGPDIAEELMHILANKTLQDIDEAKVEIKDDRAELSWEDEDQILVLVRIDGVWKYSTGAQIKDMNEEEFTDSMQFCNDVTAMAEQQIKKLADGKYKQPRQLLDSTRKLLEKILNPK